jgi:hypothetical protein
VRVAKPAYVGALGFDTVTTITPVAAKKLADAGMRFAVRYLGSIYTAELDTLLDAGIAVMPVTYSRAPGWLPSGPMGTADGIEAVRHLQAAGFPKGVTVWRDLEGPGGAPQDIIDWVNAWCKPVREAGYDPGLYVGYGAKLTSKQLYDLAVDRYWHSLSRVTDNANALAEPGCGWCMYQLYDSVTWAGATWVDVNVIQKDYRGRLPVWCSRA